MKFFRTIRNLCYIAAIVGVSYAAHYYTDTIITIQMGEWQSTLTPAVAIGGFVLLYFITTLILKLIHTILSAPILINHWFQKRAVISKSKSLEDGVRAWVRGDYARALKVFQRIATQKEQDEVYIWLAAEAAEKIGARQKRNQFLQRIAARSSDTAEWENAKKSGKSDYSFVAAAKAKLAQGDGRLQNAFEILSAAGAPDSAPLLTKMYLDIAKECEKWDCALTAAYHLRQVTPSPKCKQVVLDIAKQGLLKIADKEQLHSFWKDNIRSDEQKQPSLLADYISALHRLGDQAAITKALERAIKPYGQTPEILSIIATLGTHKMCETAFAAVRKPEEAALLPTMAQLAMRLELWGQARRYYQMAAALHPDSSYAAALSKIEEKIRGSAESNDSTS